MHGVQEVQLRLLLDHSLLEVFTGNGRALTSRMYRSTPPEGVNEGMYFVAFGGTAVASDVEAFEMKSIWTEKEDLPEPAQIFA